MGIRVDSTGHFFCRGEDPPAAGSAAAAAGAEPFFYLADTAWMLFSKLTEGQARTLFEDRAAKGFTAVQAVVFRDLFEPNTENAYGIRPFASEADMWAVRMNPEWLDYVKRIVAVAAEYGLMIGLLPTWGDKWNEHSNSAGPVIMDQDSAERYCRTLSDALAAHENVVWILGGDSPVQEQRHADTITAMARGIRSGGSGDRLITFHPSGLGSSALFHSQDWLDFNALQTSHFRPNVPGYLHIERLFHQQPTKPCLDMEPNYEYSPMFVLGRGNQLNTPVFDAYDVRKSYYRTVLAGAAGFTYGCEPIRQLFSEGDRIHIWEDVGLPTWTESLSAPGSSQLSLLPRLLTERSYFTRLPAPELFQPIRQAGAWTDAMSIGIPTAGGQNVDPASHVSVSRFADGSAVVAYTPVRQLLRIDTSGLRGSRLRLSIWDPQLMALQEEVELQNPGTLAVVPDRDLDSVIVIDALE